MSNDAQEVLNWWRSSTIEMRPGVIRSCGLPLTNAMASAVDMLGGVHGGAGQQALELCYDFDRRIEAGAKLHRRVQFQDASPTSAALWRRILARAAAGQFR